MITLHKPERATYGQAVEAQHKEYNYVFCHNGTVVCKEPWGSYNCCE